MRLPSNPAALGAIVWLAAFALARPSRVDALLLLGPLVAVPLGLLLPERTGRTPRGPWRLAAVLSVAGGATLALSFAWTPGTVAGLCAVPWLFVTLAVAGLGVWRLVERGKGPLAELAIDAAHVFLAVGGVWTFAARAGTGLVGFAEPWVTWTAAHFHFAGFALPLLTGLAGRARPGPLARASALGVITGVPLVALGITLGADGLRTVELFAALWLALAGLGVALLHVRARRRVPVLAVAGLCLTVGMALVVVYAVGAYTGKAFVDTTDMERWHAPINVLGFALPALLYWSVVGPRPGPSTTFQLLVPRLGDAPDPAAWEARAFSPGTADGPRPGDARDAHEMVVGAAGAGAHERAAAAIAAFAVFPERYAEPCIRRAPVEVGDTLVLVYHLLPGVDVTIGARVIAVFDDTRDGARRTGFTYRTLEGHPFVGEEDFVVETASDGTITAALRSWSRPATPAIFVLRPWVRWLQLRGGRAAAAHLADVARGPIDEGRRP